MSDLTPTLTGDDMVELDRVIHLTAFPSDDARLRALALAVERIVAARLAAVTHRADPVHTRTATPSGPDYCAECSRAATQWVTWPCSPEKVIEASRWTNA